MDTERETILESEVRDIEERVQTHIDDLPGELRTKWQKQLDDAKNNELPELEKRLTRFLRERNSALMRSSMSMSSLKKVEKEEEKIYEMLAKIGKASEDPTLFIGEGKTGEVFRDAENKDTCYKTVINFKEYEAWNSVEREGYFLGELDNLIVDGVRTPHFYTAIDLPEVKVLAMEYIDGKDIETYIEKRLPLPPGFNCDVFFKKVRAYLDAMHARNIYHRDLHGGNILIGKDGTPYIIDFGRAVTAYSPEHAYDQYDRTGTIKIKLTSDEDYLESVETKLRAYSARFEQ